MQDSERPVSVALVVANRLFCQGLTMLLEADGRVDVVIQADSCEGAAGELARVLPDVLVVELPDTSDVGVWSAAAASCLTASPGSRLIVLAGFEDSGSILELFEQGIHGYILKRNRSEVLIDAVHAVARDRYVVDTQVTWALIDAACSMRRSLDECCSETPLDPGLTERQCELITLVAEGMTNRQIATRLGISESTVKNHLHQVFTRLGARSRSQAIGVAMRLGLVRR